MLLHCARIFHNWLLLLLQPERHLVCFWQSLPPRSTKTFRHLSYHLKQTPNPAIVCNKKKSPLDVFITQRGKKIPLGGLWKNQTQTHSYHAFLGLMHVLGLPFAMHVPPAMLHPATDASWVAVCRLATGNLWSSSSISVCLKENIMELIFAACLWERKILPVPWGMLREVHTSEG